MPSGRTPAAGSFASRPFGPIADFAAVSVRLPGSELGGMRRLAGQSDAVHAVGLTLDRDLQLAIGGAKGELDVAGDDRPVIVAAEQVEFWLARHGVDIGLQFDR